MTTDELIAALSDRAFCISCLATVTATLPQADLLALFSGDVQSRVERCVGCGRSTRMTYRFHVPRPVAA